MKIEKLGDVFFCVIQLPIEDDEKISFLSKELVKKAACEIFGIKNPELVKTKMGKPFFVNYPNIFFSISHAENIITFAFSNHYEIGIDIEKVHSVSPGLIKKYFSLEEKNYINVSNIGEKRKRILEVWTAKEAHCKNTGEGLTKENLYWDSISQSDYCVSHIRRNELIISISQKREFIK